MVLPNEILKSDPMCSVCKSFRVVFSWCLLGNSKFRWKPKQKDTHLYQALTVSSSFFYIPLGFIRRSTWKILSYLRGKPYFCLSFHFCSSCLRYVVNSNVHLECRSMKISGFKANMVYSESSRSVRDTQKHPVWTNNTNNKISCVV